MSYIDEYIKKLREKSIEGLMTEQSRLIKKFNIEYDAELFVFATCMEKNLPESSLSTSDYEVIHDLLQNKSGKKIFFFLETKGGSGEAAKDIAELLHSKFDEVNFLIAGQAMSAGTILALSGDEIYMTETGSLGPIDAQVSIGRAVSSAHGYLKWVDDIRKEAAKNGRLNPFDATMVAQISPGELSQVQNSLQFAINLVKEWLPKYKFKNWRITETSKITVTPEMKQTRAEEIATALTDQSRWNSHGRTLKIKDLNNLRLKIRSVDADQKMSNLVYRIKAINRMLFGTTTAYKIYMTDVHRIQRNATPKGGNISFPQNINLKDTEATKLDIKCSKCNKEHKLYVKFKDNKNIDDMMKHEGLKPFPKNKMIKCSCGDTIDLVGPLSEIETMIGMKAILK
nr:peptidase [Desulfobacula sp.]